MRNFAFKHNNKTLWYSRSLAVCAKVFCLVDGILYLLIVKRGPSVSHPYTWGLPAGFLDFNETLKKACIREVHEETGLNLTVTPYEMVILDKPEFSKDQTITVLYKFMMLDNKVLPKVTNEFCEPNEILEVKWIPIGETHRYNWMYNEKLKKELGL